MNRMHHVALASVAVLALVVGCNDASLPDVGNDPLTRQMASIAVASDDITHAMLEAQLNTLPSGSTSGNPSAATVTDEITFSRTRSCPLGGEVSVDATLTRTSDSDTGEMEATFTGTRTRTDCTFARGDLSITVNSSAQFDAFRRRVNGVPDGPQTTSYSGSINIVRSDGVERSCDFSVEVVRDPDTRTRTVTGIICGDQFTRVTTYDPGG